MAEDEIDPLGQEAVIEPAQSSGIVRGAEPASVARSRFDKTNDPQTTTPAVQEGFVVRSEHDALVNTLNAELVSAKAELEEERQAHVETKRKLDSKADETTNTVDGEGDFDPSIPRTILESRAIIGHGGISYAKKGDVVSDSFLLSLYAANGVKMARA